MDRELKAKIEVILYCLPKGVHVRELAEKLGLASAGLVRRALEELQTEWAGRRSLELVEEGGYWKFKIPEKYLELVKAAADPELSQAVLETLAYIAYRGGARQCDVVRVRSSRAYNHIKELIERGFLTAEKSGLSKFLRPTKKFYEYFKLKPGERLKLDKMSESQTEDGRS